MICPTVIRLLDNIEQTKAYLFEVQQAYADYGHAMSVIERHQLLQAIPREKRTLHELQQAYEAHTQFTDLNNYTPNFKWEPRAVAKNITYQCQDCNSHHKKLYKLTPKTKTHTYFLTYTLDPKKVQPTEDKFHQVITKELNKSNYITAKYVLEHVDSNMHAHCLVTVKAQPTKRDFTKYEKDYGHVDFKPVQNDNGVEQYMSKENKIFTIK